MAIHHRFDSPFSCLVLQEDGGAPLRLAWLGAPLNPDAVAEAAAMPPRGSTPDSPVHASLFPTPGLGWFGPTALEGCDSRGRMLVPAWDAVEVTRHSDGVDVRHRCGGPGAALTADQSIRLDPATGVLGVTSAVTSAADANLNLHRLASLVLPLPAWAQELLVLDGRWISEGRPHRMIAPPGAWERTNRTGRSGFTGASLLVGEAGFGEQHGQCLLVHLAWSGSHRLRVDTLPDGQRLLLVEALLEPGEVILAPGQRFEAPEALVAWSGAGIDTAANRLADCLRARQGPARGGRPVHFNTWEAVYFDFDAARLQELAAQAADLGCERFVLDDGWFQGRSSDRAALGDWTPDPQRFPQGLGAFVAAVERAGLDFGIWVEPEMVSPDSNLHRAASDWALGHGGQQPTMRSQLVLDLALPEVVDHLSGALDALLRHAPVSYLKWDFNRDLFPPTRAGRAVGHQRVLALYQLLDDLRTRWPDLQVETCSSGGARMDAGMLLRTDRVWPSDNTDPVSRLRILRWATLAAPLEMLGSHVGSNPNPSTSRSHPIGLRCAVALFGWIGVEADPGRLEADEAAVLRRAIAAWKDWRTALAAPRVVRLAGLGLMQVGADLALAVVDVAAGCALPGLPAGPWRVAVMAPDLTGAQPLCTTDAADLAAGRLPPIVTAWDGFSLLVLTRE